MVTKKVEIITKRWKEDSPKIENIAASTTLGDIDALAELKAKLEKGEKK